MQQVIIFTAQYMFVFVLLGLALAWILTKHEQKVRFIIMTLLAGGVAFVLSRIAAAMYFDPRPFVTLHVAPLIAHAADNGFPSDHALLTGTLTAVAYFYNKKIALIMTLLTIAVGAARVLANVHTPLDILAGWSLGFIGAFIGYTATRYIVRIYQQRKMDTEAS